MVEIPNTQITIERHAFDFFPFFGRGDDNIKIKALSKPSNEIVRAPKPPIVRKRVSTPGPTKTAKELENDKYLTVKEAEIYLKIPENTLRTKLIAGRKIPHIKRGNSIRFDRAKLDDWMESQAVEPIILN